MAQAEYKNINSDYKNMKLMTAVGIALSSWRENFGVNEYGEFEDGKKQLTAGAIAKAIGERYESVYRLEHGGGSSTCLTKYLLFIRQHDSSFDFFAKVQDIMGGNLPKFSL